MARGARPSHREGRPKGASRRHPHGPRRARRHRHGTAERRRRMTVVPLTKGKAPEVVTEDSAALEFADRYGDMLRYDHSEGAWFKFDGATWRRDGTGAAHDWA